MIRLVYIFILLLTGIILSQESSVALWSNTYSTNAIQTFNEEVTDMKISDDNFIYIVGEGELQARTPSLLLSKYTLDGELVWNRYVENTDYICCIIMDIDSQGNIYLSGGNTFTSYILLKYNPDGVLLWKKEFSESSGVSPKALRAFSDNEIYLIFLDNTKLIHIRKFNLNGDIVWKNSFQDLSAYYNNVKFDALGNILIQGRFGNFSGPYSQLGLLRFSPQGELKNTFFWSDSLGRFLYANDFAISRNGDIYASVYLYSVSTTGNNLFIRLDSTLNIKKVKEYDSVPLLSGTRLRLQSDKLYTVSRITNDPIYAASTGIIIQKYNLECDSIWAYPYYDKNESLSYAYDVSLSDSSDIYITLTHNKLYPQPVVLKFDKNGVLQWDYYIPNTTNLSNYPARINLNKNGDPYLAATFTTSETYKDYNLLKFDKQTGHVIFHNRYIPFTSTDDFPVEATMDGTGNIVLATKYNKEKNGLLKVSDSGEQEWFKPYVGDTLRTENVTSITKDIPDNIIVCGTFDGDDQINLIKYTLTGEVIWSKKYKSSKYYNFSGTRVSMDNHGDILVNARSSIYSGKYFVLLKFSSEGNFKWEVSEKTSSYDNSDESYIAIDDSNNIATFVPADFLTKYNKDGTLLWSLDLSLLNKFNSCQPGYDQKGNLYLYDKSDNNTISLKKISPSGNILWSFSPTNKYEPDNSSISDIIISQNSIYATGQVTIDGRDVFILWKIDFDGNLVWENFYTYQQPGLYVREHPNSSIYVINKSGSILQFQPDGKLIKNVLLENETSYPNREIKSFLMDKNGDFFITSLLYENRSDQYPRTIYVQKVDANTLSVLEGFNGNYIKSFSLQPNFPNPFNPSTRLNFLLPTPGKVSISIFSSNGRLIRSFNHTYGSPGKHSITWDGTNNKGQIVTAGVYFYSVRFKNLVKSGKMVLLK